MPGLKSTFLAKSPDHQSHADLPGSIQEVSASAEGGAEIENEVVDFNQRRRAAS